MPLLGHARCPRPAPGRGDLTPAWTPTASSTRQRPQRQALSPRDRATRAAAASPGRAAAARSPAAQTASQLAAGVPGPRPRRPPRSTSSRRSSSTPSWRWSRASTRAPCRTRARRAHAAHARHRQGHVRERRVDPGAEHRRGRPLPAHPRQPVRRRPREDAGRLQRRAGGGAARRRQCPATRRPGSTCARSSRSTRP